MHRTSAANGGLEMASRQKTLPCKKTRMGTHDANLDRIGD
ncbi:toxin C-terminal domain-containing protein [Nocardia vulneris]